jgi:Arabinose efflux permease
VAFIVSGTKQFRKATLSLFAGGFVTFAILYSTQPLLPVFAKTYHILPASASLTLSLTTGALATTLLLSSILSEQWGQKKIMVLSLFLSALIAILTALTPSFLSLVTLRIAQGVTLAGLPSIAMAYVDDEFETKSLGMAMGLYVSGTTIGGMFGRIIVGTISDFFSWKIALGTVGVISLIFAIWFWINLPEPVHFVKKKPRQSAVFRPLFQHLKSVDLLCLFGIAFLLMGGFVTLFNYIGFLLIRPPYSLSQFAISWIFVVYLCGTFSAAYMGKLADTRGSSGVLAASMGLMLTGLILTLFLPLLIKIIGIAIFTFGFFGSHSIASGWVGRFSGDHAAQAASLYLFFYYAGSSLIGTFGGTIWHLYRWVGIVLLISLCIVLALALETTLFHHELAERNKTRHKFIRDPLHSLKK